MVQPDHKTTSRKVKEFVKEHKVKLLVGATILFALANRGLRNDVRELRVENKELKNSFEETQQLTAKATKDLERAESILDSYFGARRY